MTHRAIAVLVTLVLVGCDGSSDRRPTTCRQRQRHRSFPSCQPLSVRSTISTGGTVGAGTRDRSCQSSGGIFNSNGEIIQIVKATYSSSSES